MKFQSVDGMIFRGKKGIMKVRTKMHSWPSENIAAFLENGNDSCAVLH